MPHEWCSAKSLSLSGEIENTVIGRHLNETLAARTSGSDDGRTTFAPNEYKMPLYRGIIEADLLAVQKVFGVLQP